MSKTITTSAYRDHIKWLREVRAHAEITQARLAARLGQQQSYVAKVETLERKLDVHEYVQWVRALNLDPSESIKHLAANVRTPKPRLLDN